MIRCSTVVLEDRRPFTPLCVKRAGGEETQLFVKEVIAAGKRYIVCRNEAEAAKDVADRAAVIAALDRQLKRGDKALIGNSAYRRFLRPTTAQHAFEIDPGKVADEARFDGIFVLRTNARITPLQAVLRYRDLIQVEALFKTAKSLMRTRPIYHSSDAAIRGHVFCSFLALILARNSTPAAAGPACSRSGATCCAISIGCSAPASTMPAKAGACGPKPTGAPPLSCMFAASRRRHGSRRPRHRGPRPRNPPLHGAAADRGVVPHAPEFPGFLRWFNDFAKSGVQVQSGSS